MEYISLIVLSIFLLLATATDFKHQKIPNKITFTGLAAGLILSVLTSGELLNGFLFSVYGAASGLLLLLPVYAYGKMGAGDVKLLAMVGAFLGANGAFWACIWSLLVGGLLAIAWVVYSLGLWNFCVKTVGAVTLSQLDGVRTQLRPSSSGVLKSNMPYAGAIAAGSVIAYIQALYGYT